MVKFKYISKDVAAQMMKSSELMEFQYLEEVVNGGTYLTFKDTIKLHKKMMNVHEYKRRVLIESVGQDNAFEFPVDEEEGEGVLMNESDEGDGWEEEGVFQNQSSGDDGVAMDDAGGGGLCNLWVDEGMFHCDNESSGDHCVAMDDAGGEDGGCDGNGYDADDYNYVVDGGVVCCHVDDDGCVGGR
eukprot:4006041-Ditylum_brightwellii.AAC.1